MNTNKHIKNILLAAAAAFVMACTTNVSDFWAALEGVEVDTATTDGDTDTDTDTDIDVDVDSDTDEDGGMDGGQDTDEDSDTTECNETDTGCVDTSADTDSSTTTDTTTGTPPLECDAGVDTDTEPNPFCTSVEFEAYLAGIPVVLDNSSAPLKGNGDTPEVTITEFSHFACSHCANASAVFGEMFEDPCISSRVAFYYRHYSFTTDPAYVSCQAHLAAQAAHYQGAFWEMHDAIFAAFPVSTYDQLEGFALAAGLDMDQWAIDFACTPTYEKVFADKAEGQSLGVYGTPTLFVDGVKVIPWTSVPDVVDCLLDGF